MALVTVERLLEIQAAFHHCWDAELSEEESIAYLENNDVKHSEILFYSEWAATQPNNDMPE